MVKSFNDTIPIYAIFLFVIIIFADSAKNIFPCRIVNLIENNLFVKYFIAYLTIVFLVVLTVPIPDKKLSHIMLKSFYLLILFILISKTEVGFFIPILFTTGLMYILILQREEFKEKLSNSPNKVELENKINNLIKINNIVMVLIIIMIIIGVLLYMGRKKYEYKNSFNYLTFFLGKIDCNKSFPNINYQKSIKYIFN